MSTVEDAADQLVGAAGGEAVRADDIRQAAYALGSTYPRHSQIDIRSAIADIVTRIHGPGVSGSVLRPFQTLTRAQIASRIANNTAESMRLGQVADEKDREMNRSPNAPMTVRAPLLALAMEATRRSAALLTEIGDLQFEIHIRDTPSLRDELGPGAD